MTQQMCQVLSRSEAAYRYKPHLQQVCQLKAKTNILELFIHFLHIFFPLAIFENFSFVEIICKKNDLKLNLKAVNQNGQIMLISLFVENNS